MRLVRWAAAAVLAVTGLAAVAANHQAGAVQTRPNIIVVMVDDMRSDDLAAMPQTRAIIGTQNGLGARYDNAIASVPLCCPSRVTLLTGQYAHNHQVTSNEQALGGGWRKWHATNEETNSLPIWLDDAGYRTMMVGKYINGYGQLSDRNPDTYVPPGWDFWAGMVHGAGYIDFEVNVQGTVQRVRDGYSTTNLGNRASFRLNASLDSDVPIFMWLSLYAPHDAGPQFACDVPAEPRYAGVSRPGPPAGAGFNEADVSDKPGWVQERPRLTGAEVGEVGRCRGERRDSLKSVDDVVAQVRDRLAAHGELANTVLVFVSDNGPMLGVHRVCCFKQWPYEESAGVPLLVHGPGLPTGVKTRVVSNVDLAASIVDWADASPTLPLDGQSLDVPAVPGHNRAVLVERLVTNSTQPDPPVFAGVRLTPTTGFPQPMMVDYTTGLDELYDKPPQTVNKIGDPAYDVVEAQWRVLVDQLRDCQGFQPDAAASTTDCNVEWSAP